MRDSFASDDFSPGELPPDKEAVAAGELFDLSEDAVLVDEYESLITLIHHPDDDSWQPALLLRFRGRVNTTPYREGLSYLLPLDLFEKFSGDLRRQLPLLRGNQNWKKTR